MTRDQIMLSVVVVNYNAKKWLEKLFPTVLQTNYPKNKLEIILVDAGSTDSSKEWVQNNLAHRNDVKYINIPKTLGWGYALNQGIKAARGEIIVHISSDVEVTRNWLIEIVKAFNAEKIGVVQGNSISIWDRKSFDSAMNFLDKYGFSYGFMPDGRPNEVFFAEGMVFAFRKKVAEEIGMIDDYFFMEYDDQDFCWRARLAGYKVVFAPLAIVYHVRGGTIGRTYFERIRNTVLYSRNHIVSLIKNYELKNLLRALPVAIFIDVGKILFLIFKGKSRIALSNLKGLFLALKDLKIILMKRNKLQHEIRRVCDKEIIKCMVPFNPWALIAFLTSQAKGKRFVINAKPPITLPVKGVMGGNLEDG